MTTKVEIYTDLAVPTEPGEYHRLLCMTGENKGTSYILVNPRAIAGRGKRADIQILDTKASREHFELVKVKGKYVVTDMKSQNGTLINDLKITQHTLSDGDTIIVGKTIYKYSILTVLDNQIQEYEEAEVDEAEELPENEEEPQKGRLNKRVVIMAVIGVLAFMLLFGPADDKGKKKKERDVAVDIPDESFLRSLADEESKKDEKIRKQVEVYIHRGLRELREKNYYRALHEFEQAKIKMPGEKNKTRADFYVRKTQKALDEEIDKMFEKAQRDRDSLKLNQAIQAYCGVLRLIDRNPNDERYIAAKRNIKTIRKELGIKKKLGNKKNETECE